MPLAIEFDCCEKLANDGEFLPFYQEFCRYKQLSAEHSRPDIPSKNFLHLFRCSLAEIETMLMKISRIIRKEKV